MSFALIIFDFSKEYILYMAQVSVLLPAYNAESTIAEAIQSIIDQTYKDWELYVINDGSEDQTEEVILSFKDNRIRYLKNDRNMGLIYTLNRGLAIAGCKYIARMDADDICMSTRFEKQVLYLELHPEVVICGTQIEYFGTKSNNYTKLFFPTKDKELKEMLAVSTCFAHPTIMMRRKVMVDNKIQYDYNYKNAEDYCMWIEMMKFGKFANLDEPLLQYRISDTQVSQPFNLQTINSVMACKRKYLEQYLLKEEVDDLFEYPIDISTIKGIKQKLNNPRVIEACYLSLEEYSLKSLLYYLFSTDVFKLGFGAFIRYMKRFILGQNPVYCNVRLV